MKEKKEREKRDKENFIRQQEENKQKKTIDLISSLRFQVKTLESENVRFSSNLIFYIFYLSID